MGFLVEFFSRGFLKRIGRKFLKRKIVQPKQQKTAKNSKKQQKTAKNSKKQQKTAKNSKNYFKKFLGG